MPEINALKEQIDAHVRQPPGVRRSSGWRRRGNCRSGNYASPSSTPRWNSSARSGGPGWTSSAPGSPLW